MSPIKIIDECIDRYANLSSYQDKGIVCTRNSNKSEPAPYQITFSTLFAKPNLFRFEYMCPHPYPQLKHIYTRYVCGFDGERAYTLRQRHEEQAIIEIEESLSYAVARSIGTSCSSIYNIAKLLFPNINGPSLSDLSDVKLVGEEEFERLACYVITGVNPKHELTSVLVSKSDFAIFRFLSVKSDYQDEELRTQISLNKEINRDSFLF